MTFLGFGGRFEGLFRVRRGFQRVGAAAVQGLLLGSGDGRLESADQI